MSSTFAQRQPARLDLCEHCGDKVTRVWLVPGDVLNSCSGCYLEATGRRPAHDQGHSTQRGAGTSRRPVASFHVRVDGRRPA